MPTSERPRTSWEVWLATGLGLGWSPAMPGTVGALWGLPLAWAIGQAPAVWLQVVCIAAICAAGVPLCTRAAALLGGKKDPSCIVFDEVASLPIVFFLAPVDRPLVLLAGFVLHRLFDIAKPPPTRRLERLPNGLGIMADDWMAGVFANLALHALLWWNPGGVFL